MGKVILNATGGSSIANTTTRYTPVSGAIQSGTVEADTQSPFRTAGGAITNLTCNISANTTTAASTFRLRVGGANVNNVISVNAATTGQFEDTSSSDTIASADLVNYTYVGGGGGSYTLASLGCTFLSSGNTFSKLCGNGQVAVTYALSNTVAYIGFGRATLEQTTEAIVGTKVRNAFTASNLFLRVTSNARATTTTVKSRKNGADGNMLVSVATLTTGSFEDNSNTDSLASADVFNFSILGGVEVTNFLFSVVSAEIVSSGSEFIVPATNNAPGSVGSGNTRYMGIGGAIVPNATEANVEARVNYDFTASKFFLYVAINAAGTGTGRIRINAGNSAISVSVGSGATGLFEDTSNTQAFVDNDTIAFLYAAVTSAQTITAFGFMGQSGTTYNDSVAESVTATDAQSATAVFPVSTAESVPATDAQSAAAVFPASVSESVTATDAQSATAVFAGSVSETATATDAQSATASFVASVAESANATDASSATAIFAASRAESVTASDAQNTTAILNVTVSETVTATDRQSLPGPPPPPQPSGGGIGGGGASARGRRPVQRIPHFLRQPQPQQSSELEITYDDLTKQFASPHQQDEEDICAVVALWMAIK